MKEIILSLAFAVISSISYAQWSGTSPVYYTGGNVGIGTASPFTSLHVAGSGGLFGNILTTVTPYIYSNGISSGLGYGLMSNTSFSNNGAISNIGLLQQTSNSNDITAGIYLSIHGWYQNSGTSLPISIGGGYSGISPSLYIAAGGPSGAGNVGIGTTNPSASLEINGNQGNVDSRNLKLTYSAGGSLTNTELSGLAHLSSELGIGWTALYAKQGSASFAAVFNGNTFFANGNVGIGTTQPDQKLTVNGTIHSKEVKVDTSIMYLKKITN